MLSSLPFRISLIFIVVTFTAALGTGLLVVALTGNVSPTVIAVLIIVPLSVTILTGLATYLAMRRLFRPLDRLSESAARLATGDLETAIPVQGSHELRTLARTLENARHELLG